jgi:hypothetical protein
MVSSAIPMSSAKAKLAEQLSKTIAHIRFSTFMMVSPCHSQDWVVAPPDTEQYPDQDSQAGHALLKNLSRKYHRTVTPAGPA